MTLHVSFISPAFVMQIGDRLLTTGDPGNATEWEAYANKTVLLQAINGCVAISFAGLGILKRCPRTSG
jgi:hypothetical protein